MMTGSKTIRSFPRSYFLKKKANKRDTNKEKRKQK